MLRDFLAKWRNKEGKKNERSKANDDFPDYLKFIDTGEPLKKPKELATNILPFPVLILIFSITLNWEAVLYFLSSLTVDLKIKEIDAIITNSYYPFMLFSEILNDCKGILSLKYLHSFFIYPLLISFVYTFSVSFVISNLYRLISLLNKTLTTYINVKVENLSYSSYTSMKNRNDELEEEVINLKYTNEISLDKHRQFIQETLKNNSSVKIINRENAQIFQDYKETLQDSRKVVTGFSQLIIKNRVKAGPIFKRLMEDSTLSHEVKSSIKEIYEVIDLPILNDEYFDKLEKMHDMNYAKLIPFKGINPLDYDKYLDLFREESKKNKQNK